MKTEEQEHDDRRSRAVLLVRDVKEKLQEMSASELVEYDVYRALTSLLYKQLWPESEN